MFLALSFACDTYNRGYQAITPTMIIILAAMQLTSNDVHSRMTRTRGAQIIRRPFDSTSVPLDTMQFADNNNVIKTSALASNVSSVWAEQGSFGKPEPQMRLA